MPPHPIPASGFLRATLIALATAALIAGAAEAAPLRPTDDAYVLTKASPGQNGFDRDLRAAEKRLAGEPENLGLAVQTARLAIERGRASADPRLYGRAQAALAPWWKTEDPPDQARVLRAIIRQALHEFPAALADLDATIARNPENAQARLSRAFVRMVVGDVSGAAEDCRGLPPAAALPAAICSARVDALSGKAAAAYDRLSQALSTASGAGEPVRRFGVAVLADMAVALGRHEEAGRLFAAAAADGAPDIPLLAAAADHLLDRGRTAEALTLLDGQGESDALLLRRAIAAKKLGDPRLAEWAAVLNERFSAAAMGGVAVHQREEARFRLEVEGNPAAALPLAVANWRSQKEPADARLLLQSAIAASDPAAATDALKFVQATGLADSRVTLLVESLRGKRS